MKLRQLGRELIEPDPDQPRRTIEEPDTLRLAESIRLRGILQPIIVCEHDGRFRIIDGHRRFAAGEIAGLAEMPALVVSGMPDDETVLMMQLTANCLRVDLRPTELAVALQKLQERRGWSQSQLAEAMQMSKSMVTQTLSFLTLPTALQTKLDNGELARSTAYAIARETDDSRRQELMQRAMKGGLKRDEANGSIGKREHRDGLRRLRFKLGLMELSMVMDEQFNVEDCLTALQELTRQCRFAAKQRITLTTLERILAEKAQRAEQDT